MLNPIYKKSGAHNLFDLEIKICQVVQKTLCENLPQNELSKPITPQSTMATVEEWDSLSFVNVFLSVSAHFQIDVEEDDAIHFQSIQGIRELIEVIREL